MTTSVRVLIVGAGASGIATAVKLTQAGIDDFLVLEKADRVGGTWRENTYPGCGCDVPSAMYSFTFAANRDWSRLFAGQPEILAYLDDTARRHGIHARVRFGTELLEARWDESARRWQVATSGGAYEAQVLVAAAGPITEPSLPDLPGLDGFPGEVFHSARWRHDVDLFGKRVAVIGTGASAIQFVPQIRKVAAEVTLFQRTASWVVPKPDFPMPSLVRRIPLVQRGLRTIVDATLDAATFTMRHQSLLAPLEAVARLQLRAQVPDRTMRDALTPQFRLGCKRLLLSNDYFPALASGNVTLVPHAATRVDGSTLVAADGTRHEVDVIILATGFDVAHPPIATRIHGRDGSLGDRWKTSPEAYLGLTVPGAPNAFVLLGPNILVYSSFIYVAELQAGYVADALRRMERDGIETVEVRPEAVERLNADIQAALPRTVWNSGGCASYYLDEAGRNFAAWPWSLASLRRRLARFDVENYLTVSQEPALALT